MENANVRDLLHKMREEEYGEYREDVEIAINELAKMKLYPVPGRILCDLYAIPSHNYQTYFAIVYEKDDGYEMVYAKPQFYEPITRELIKMYRFKDAKEVEKHPVKSGKIIIGIKTLPDGFLNLVKDIVLNLPTVKFDEEGFVLDGCFQAIRVYKDNAVCDEVVFKSADEIELPKGKEYLVEALNTLYIEMGEIIE